MSSEKPAENLRHAVGGLPFIKALQALPFKCPWSGLENPGRAASLVLIGMRDKRTPLGLLEDEGEGIERTRRSHPRKVVGADVDLGLEVFDMLFTEAAVDAVGEDDQVGAGEARFILD